MDNLEVQDKGYGLPGKTYLLSIKKEDTAVVLLEGGYERTIEGRDLVVDKSFRDGFLFNEMERKMIDGGKDWVAAIRSFRLRTRAGFLEAKAHCDLYKERTKK